MMFEYSSTVFSQEVWVTESDQDLEVKGVFSMLITLVFLASLGFVIFIKGRERITGISENKRPKSPNPTVIDKLKDFISA
mmetsp:Transcript_10927/g.11067  ORF Transcript_10927/g.11067 Transcript_10927/m.11067 type:complete len:80 (-) Transcript_10927:37-276(-)